MNTFSKISGYSKEALDHQWDWIWKGDDSNSKDYYIATFQAMGYKPFEFMSKNFKDIERSLKGYLGRNNITAEDLFVAEVRKEGKLLGIFDERGKFVRI